MATLLYGDKPLADVEAGNRADTADTPVAPSPPAGAIVPTFRSSMGPLSPTPSRWTRPYALRGLVYGVVSAAVVFAGLTMFGIAIAWSSAMTTSTRGALMILGACFVVAGLAYVIAADPRSATSTP